MLATDPALWSNEDIDIVMFRAQTTIGGPETFKWILPAFLDRTLAGETWGWMTDTEILVNKLDHAGFDTWPTDQRETARFMLIGWLARRSAYSAEGDDTSDPGDDLALRKWLEARKT